jgi:hypothetical protein
MDLDRHGIKPYVIFACLGITLAGLAVTGTLIWDRYKISSWESEAREALTDFGNETQGMIDTNNEVASLKREVSSLKKRLNRANRELTQYHKRESSVLGTGGNVKRIEVDGEIRYVENIQQTSR